MAAALIFTGSQAFSQDIDKKESEKKVPNGWHLLDAEKDGFSGISLSQAYELIQAKKLKSKKGRKLRRRLRT